MSDSRNSRNLTIKDVARAAGVSTQTVSRVINNRPDVAPDTRARILQVISELGYMPNIIAKSLSSGRSNTLGVIGFGLEYFGSTSVLRAIEKRANEIGFSILLSLLDEFEMEHVDRILQKLFSRQVEGVIWSIPDLGKKLEGLTSKFAEVGIPVVFLNKEQNGDNMVVALNNRAGGRMATKHLLAMGYHQIGIITGPAEWWESTQREAGWRAAMEEAGIGALEALIAEGDWTASSGEAGLYQLLEQTPTLDAVFVSNDQMALGVLKAARELKLRVPEDLGVVGFDDIPEAAYFYPTLTTVQQDTRQLGAMAVEKLHNFIRSTKKSEANFQETTWVEPQLIIRESSQRTAMKGSE